VLINQRRAAGATCDTTYFPPVAPLVNNPQLRQSARCHSLDMAQNGYLSHYSLDGRFIFQRIYDASYTAWGTDEDIAGDFKTAQDVVSAWMSDYGHCAAIMGTIYSHIPYQSTKPGNNEVGVGYGATTAGDWTLDFGWRSSVTPPNVTATCSISPSVVPAGATFTVRGSGLGAYESFWESYVDDGGIFSVGNGANGTGTFTNTATANASGGEGWVVLFDYNSLQQIGRCSHL
jgi:hypothetical protein